MQQDFTLFFTTSNYFHELAREKKTTRRSRLPIKCDFITIGQAPVCDNAETTPLGGPSPDVRPWHEEPAPHSGHKFKEWEE